jgi:peroxiredoxin
MTMRQAAAEEKAKVQSIVGDKFGLITGDIERVRNEGTIEDALKVGQSVPDFTLPDAFGAQTSIRTLLATGPVVIMFYRGEWCPFCNIEMHAMQKALPQMQELGATLVAISPEKPDHGIVMAEKNKLTFPVLSDYDNKVARAVWDRVPDEQGVDRLCEGYFQERHRPSQWPGFTGASGSGDVRR